MEEDQIELLTQEHSRDVRRVLDALPVKSTTKPADAVKATISAESEDLAPPGEGPVMQAFMSGLSWATYALAIAAAILLTWAAGGAFTR